MGTTATNRNTRFTMVVLVSQWFTYEATRKLNTHKERGGEKWGEEAARGDER